MAYRNDWTVQQGDVRPARPDGTCFYCSKPLGSDHKDGCVIRTKTVVMDVTIRLVREVPEDWDTDMIEFHMNDGSWCADNILPELEKAAEKGGCLCHRLAGKFVRDADEEDHERYGIFNRDTDSRWGSYADEETKLLTQ